MFEAVLNLFRSAPRAVEPLQPQGQECFNCAIFDYCDPNDIDGTDGYCGIIVAGYGRWACHDEWCSQWQEVDAIEMQERRTRRAQALGDAAKKLQIEV